MSNHIDDLLKDMDEILNVQSPQKLKNEKNEKSNYSPKKEEIKKKETSSISPEKKKNELDSLLDDLMGVEETKNEKSINLKNNDTFSQKNPQIKQKTKKCYQFLISDEELICTKTELFKGQTICDKLRCTNCDQKVKVYKGFCFEKDCDYLFFRNYSMNEEQIKKKLIKNLKMAAYHCQCSWISVDKTIQIGGKDCSFKWVCAGGH